MKCLVHAACALALLPAAFAAAPAQAQARDPRNDQAWDFRERGSADRMGRATLMWQVERAESGKPGPASASGGSAGGPSTTAVANMTVVNVTVGDNGRADVIVDSNQRNTGDVDSTAVVATGDVVDIGRIGDGPEGSR